METSVCDYCGKETPPDGNYAGEYDSMVCESCAGDIEYFKGDYYDDPSINCR